MYIPKIPCIPQATGSGWIIASLITSDQLWWLPSLNTSSCAHITAYLAVLFIVEENHKHATSITGGVPIWTYFA